MNLAMMFRHNDPPRFGLGGLGYRPVDFRGMIGGTSMPAKGNFKIKGGMVGGSGRGESKGKSKAANADDDEPDNEDGKYGEPEDENDEIDTEEYDEIKNSLTNPQKKILSRWEKSNLEQDEFQSKLDGIDNGVFRRMLEAFKSLFPALLEPTPTPPEPIPDPVLLNVSKNPIKTTPQNISARSKSNITIIDDDIEQPATLKPKTVFQNIPLQSTLKQLQAEQDNDKKILENYKPRAYNARKKKQKIMDDRAKEIERLQKTQEAITVKPRGRQMGKPDIKIRSQTTAPKKLTDAELKAKIEDELAAELDATLPKPSPENIAWLKKQADAKLLEAKDKQDILDEKDIYSYPLAHKRANLKKEFAPKHEANAEELKSLRSGQRKILRQRDELNETDKEIVRKKLEEELDAHGIKGESGKNFEDIYAALTSNNVEVKKTDEWDIFFKKDDQGNVRLDDKGKKIPIAMVELDGKMVPIADAYIFDIRKINIANPKKITYDELKQFDTSIYRIDPTTGEEYIDNNSRYVDGIRLNREKITGNVSFTPYYYLDDNNNFKLYNVWYRGDSNNKGFWCEAKDSKLDLNFVVNTVRGIKKINIKTMIDHDIISPYEGVKKDGRILYQMKVNDNALRKPPTIEDVRGYDSSAEGRKKQQYKDVLAVLTDAYNQEKVNHKSKFSKFFYTPFNLWK